MKPFNLQEVLAGKPVVTRYGKAVKQIVYFPGPKDYSVIAYTAGEEVDTYTVEGKYFHGPSHTSGHDLFMGGK